MHTKTINDKKNKYKDSKKKKVILLLIYRWMTLGLMLLSIYFKQRQYFYWSIETGLFGVLLVYSFLVSLIYPILLREKSTIKLLNLADILAGLLISSVTGVLDSPFIFYIIGAVFSNLFLFKERGIFESVLVLLSGYFLIAFMVDGLKINLTVSKSNMLILLTQFLLFLIFYKCFSHTGYKYLSKRGVPKRHYS